jgi:hypothetical protein
MKPQRIFMQQEDGAPTGAPPPPAPAPTDPPAPGASPAVDVTAIAAAVAQQVKDGVFAELRRTGVLGKEKAPKPVSEPPPSSTTTPPPPDIGKLRMLDRAIARSPHAARLNDAAYTRLERAFIEETPADAASWLTDYFEGMGVSATPTPAAPAAPAATPTAPAVPNAAPAPRTAVPVSGGGGSPPAPTVPLEEQDLLRLSKEDRDHLIKQKGPRWWMQTLAAQSRGKSLTVR